MASIHFDKLSIWMIAPFDFLNLCFHYDHEGGFQGFDPSECF